MKMIIMTMNLCLSSSLFPSLTSHHPLCLSTPQTGVFCVVSYPGRWLQTAGIPHGSLTRRSWTLHACLNCRVGRVQKKGDQIDSYITRIPALTHGVAQSKWNAARGGSAGGARDGEWAKARARKGRGADTRRADFSQISSHLCDKKGK